MTDSVDARAALDTLSPDQKTLVAFFGDFSAASRKAEPAFAELCRSHPELPVIRVDVLAERELARRFQVGSVPTVLLLEGTRVSRRVVGAESAEGYARQLFAAAAGAAPAAGGGTSRAAHRVAVYVTDTCPWCTTVKTYLRKHGVSYREINVSRDEAAAREMVRRSGQQGVPQIDIDGRMVVGFDKARIDSLLGLRGGADS